MYAASFFQDRARAWMEPYIDADEPPVWMESFKTFSAKLVDVFGDPDTVRNADYRLRKLRQTDTVADYVGEFRHFAQHLSWATRRSPASSSRVSRSRSRMSWTKGRMFWSSSH